MVPLFACGAGAIVGAAGKFAKKSKVSPIVAAALGALTGAGNFDEVTEDDDDDVSSPSRSMLFDEVAAAAAAFFASSREFFGECGFGSGAGIAMFTGDGAGFEGSVIVVVVDFFFRF